MCTDTTDHQSRKNQFDSNGANLRIESVDNWHTQWPSVVSTIESAGQLNALLVDRDGWLSARQVLLVAFAEKEVAGHICFRIVPIADGTGHVVVQAHLDAFGVKPGFEKLEVGPALTLAAQQRAESLKCSTRVGF